MLTLLFILVSLVIESLAIPYILKEIYKNLNKNKLIWLFVLTIIVNLFTSIMDFNAVLHWIILVLHPLFFYIFLKYGMSEIKNYLFLALTLDLALSTSGNFCAVFISSFLGDSITSSHFGLFILLSTIFSILLISQTIKLLKIDVIYFIERESIFANQFKILTYILIGIHAILNLAYILGKIAHFNSFSSILITICFLTFVSILFVLKYFRDQNEKQEEIIRKEKEQKLHQQYTNKIVALYNEIRGFRHDYAGMLTSLQMGIRTGDMKEVERIYDEVLVNANIQLRSDKYTYFDLNHVGDGALRSVMTEKILKAEESEIEVTLEVKDYVGRLPIKLLDLVRIASVILDNALESASESYAKEINISLIDLQNEIIFVVTNSRKLGNIELDEIYRTGYSSKGRNRGLGLNNVKQIIEEYDGVILDTLIERETFTQVVTFKKEGFL